MTEFEQEREPETGVGYDDAPPQPDDTPPAAEDEDEPEAATAATGEELERRIAKAERATKRYDKQIRDALEDEAANLIECPLCLSFARGFLHLGDRGNVPSEVEKAVRMWLGEQQEVSYPPAPDYSTCSMCLGLGKVSTGSRVPAWESLACADCEGRGYRGPPPSSRNGHRETAYAPPPEETATPAAATSDVDPAGEPRLLPDGRRNPNFGMWPQYKVEVPPWGTTAGLHLQEAF